MLESSATCLFGLFAFLVFLPFRPISCLFDHVTFPDSEIPESLSQMYDNEENHGKAAAPTRAQFVDLLGQCLDRFNNVYICIDALDECDPDEALKILRGLQQLPSRKSRLLVTGRTYVFETPQIHRDRETQI
jgi:hypothetical protein